MYTHYLFLIAGSDGNIVMTQSLKFMSIAVVDRFTMSCKASQNVGRYVAWYLQKPGQFHELLICEESKQHTGVPDHFIGSGSGTDFTHTISSIQAEDLADYYYQQHYDTPHTVLQSPTQISSEILTNCLNHMSPELHMPPFACS